MNLDNIDEKLEELAELFFIAEKADRRLGIIAHDLEALTHDLILHRKIMHKEHQDVVKLEKMSKYMLFVKILGDREHELERERQEYLQSVLEYNAIAHEIELLQYEKEILTKKIKDKVELKKQRDYYLKIKEQKILYNNKDHNGVIKKLNGEIQRLNLLKREIKEAVDAVDSTDHYLKRSIHYLKSMDNFGAYAIEGMTFSKKKLLNKAINNAIQVKVQIKKLDKELDDIYHKYELPSMYKYDAFIDAFHHSLITDWVLKNKLKSAVMSLQSGREQLQRILATLNHDATKSAEKLEVLTEEKRMYVLNS
jgi:hypothetical protein